MADEIGGKPGKECPESPRMRAYQAVRSDHPEQVSLYVKYDEDRKESIGFSAMMTLTRTLSSKVMDA